MKRLKLAYSQSGGRNHKGRITSYHRGGGNFRKYRLVDWNHMLKNRYAFVLKKEYDPFRKAPVVLIYYDNGFFSYQIGIHGLEEGMSVLGGRFVPLWLGNSLPLGRMPIGSIISNVESRYGRSAGARCQIIKHVGRYTVVKLPSGEKKSIHSKKWGTYGRIGRVSVRFEKEQKAGKNRHRGIRPVVRGVAMNPIDHPHGGGEGKTSGGRPSVTPWGVPTKGKKTRKR
jgi:large subunit ribosomal protein L2